MKKFLSVFSTFLSVAFLVWVVLSFINVNLHNDPFGTEYQQFANWNLFSRLLF